ncbi:MAG: TonB-dependent receptor [Rhizobacter sp.]|nr:TonB-dependent receptor [Ferruginibacter sp.]
MKKIYFIGLLFIISNAVLAQSGKITGKVMNAGSGQVLANATITLIEKSKTEIADQNGNFTFNKLEAGTYSIKCSYAGYIEKIIDEIIVKNEDNTALNISLTEKKALDEVVVTSRIRARAESVASLLITQKNSANVSDGISAESIRKTPDRSTGDVLKRVSGASIQDDRFAIIRGLNDRYNASFINGAPLPSTESDRKAFAFDIFPASILDNLVIYKTATADKSGDFAGGIIDITTKSILPKNFTSISFSLGFNSLVTGKTRYFSENKGKKDWIGTDDGSRGIPAGIPSTTELRNLTFAKKADLAKLFANYKWGIKQGNTGPDFNFQISKGFNVERKQKEFLGALFSLNYKRSYTFSEGERNTISPNGKFKDSIYNDEVVLAALANISVKLNNRNSIGWKNNLSINTDNKLVKRTGVPDLDSDPDTYVRDAVRWYTSNQIFSSQFLGEHLVGPVKTKINWLGSYSKVKRVLPNYSRTSYYGSKADPGSAFFNGTPSQLFGSGTMFFANTDENIKSIKAEITQPYSFMKNSQNLLKIGAGYQVRKRDFTSRLLGFAPYEQGGVQFDYSLNQLPEDQIFLPQHLGKMDSGQGGFLLQDGTGANTDYDASSATTQAFIMNDQRFFKKFRFIYGVRMERFNQTLNSPSGSVNRPPTTIDSTITDFLPSVNFVYALTSKMNVRLSYSQTVNRPEFRELAPFVFYDYQAQYSISGSVKLQRATIKNYDFRFEFFPGKAQLFSVSAFYKDFTSPIEIIFVPGIAGQAAYVNSQSAEVYGVEAEFRTLISTLFGIKAEDAFLSKFTLAANAAYMKSNVKLPFVAGAGTVSRVAADRPMQGQSPYLVNGSVGFNDEKTGISSTLSVNRVGDRLAVAGVKNESFDIYERARTVVDFQLAKLFLKNKLEFRFTARDILAQNISVYFDNDQSKSFTGTDIYFSSYKAPKVFTFSATYKF